MTITKKVVIDKIEIIGELRHVQIRTATVIKENDVEISRSFHRKVISADDDITNEESEIISICNIVHTQAIKDKIIAEKAKLIK